MTRIENSSQHSAEQQNEVPGQRATAQLLFYRHLLRSLHNPARNYALHYQPRYPEDSFASLHQRAKIALEDLYFGREDPTFQNQFKRDWGMEAGFLETEFLRVYPKISETRDTLLNDSAEITVWDKLKVAFFLGTKLAGDDITLDQKDHIYELAGYSPDEAKKIIQNIKNSTTLTIAASGLYSIGGTAAGGYGLSNSFLENNPNTQLAIALSFVAHYATLGLNTRQSLRLTQHPDIGKSPNAVATALYYLLEKMMPEKSKKRDAINIIVPMLPFLGIELLINGGLAATDQPSAIVAKNVVLSVMNLIESGGVEAILRLKGQKKVNNEGFKTPTSSV